MDRIRIRGKFVDLMDYPECTQFVLADVTLEEGETKNAKIKLVRTSAPGEPPKFNLCVVEVDGAECPVIELR